MECVHDKYGPTLMVDKFISRLQVPVGCECLQTSYVDQNLSLSFQHSHFFKTPACSLVRLLARLRQSGFVFVDENYCAKGLIHAKYSHLYDLWVDSFDKWDEHPKLMRLDFTAELFFDESEISTQCDAFGKEFSSCFLEAINTVGKACDLNILDYNLPHKYFLAC